MKVNREHEINQVVAAFEAAGYTVSRSSAITTNSVYLTLGGKAADEFASLFRRPCVIRISDHDVAPHVLAVSGVAFEFRFGFTNSPVANFETYVERCQVATAKAEAEAKAEADKPAGPAVEAVSAVWKLEAIASTPTETLVRYLGRRSREKGTLKLRHADGRILKWSAGVEAAVREELARREA